MNEKFKTYSVKSDVNTVDINLCNAVVEIQPTRSASLFVEHTGVNVADDGKQLNIKQTKRLFGRFFKKQTVKIFIPEHTVPSLCVNGEKISLNINGGIYAEATFNLSSGEIGLNDSAFESIDANGGALRVFAENITVKGLFKVNSLSGETLLEDVFALHTECRTRQGNIGAVNLNCKGSFLEVDSGNISATLAGGEEDFNLALAAKNGTCNREQTDERKPCAQRFLKAFTSHGNIVIDFIKEKEEAVI